MLLEASGQTTDEFTRFADAYSEHEGALLLIRQLNRLIKAVQRHRGVSMALLAGNKDYRGEFSQLQTQLQRRLATLEVFASENQLLSTQDKQNLNHAWVTIRSDWEGDKVNDNFELHSHLIQQLLAMISDLASMLKSPLAGGSGAKVEDRVSMLSFVCSAMPRLIEDIARIRGATSYMVALGSEHSFDEAKVRFWMGSVKQECSTINSGALGALEQAEPKGLSPSIGSLKQTEEMVLKLLKVADSVAFLGHASLAGSTHIFNLATEVIDRYWAVVNVGLDWIQSSHMAELDSWVEEI